MTHLVFIYHGLGFDIAQKASELPYISILQEPSNKYLQVSKVDNTEALDRVNLGFNGLCKIL